MTKAVLFDVETTGIPNWKLAADAQGQPRMCSMAAALLTDTGEIIEKFHHLIKPEGWEEEVIAKAEAEGGAFGVNGLSMKKLNAEGIPVVEVLTKFDALVDQCEGIGAFGISFDQKMARSEQRRAGRPDRYGERPTFCVMKAATDVCKIPPTDKMMAAGKRWFKQPNLGEAVRHMLGRDLPDAHDALADLMATVEIFAMMAAMPGVVVWKEQVSKLGDKE